MANDRTTDRNDRNDRNTDRKRGRRSSTSTPTSGDGGNRRRRRSRRGKGRENSASVETPAGKGQGADTTSGNDRKRGQRRGRNKDRNGGGGSGQGRRSNRNGGGRNGARGRGGSRRDTSASFEELARRNPEEAYGVRTEGPFPRLVETFTTPAGTRVGVVQARNQEDGQAFWFDRNEQRRFDTLIVGIGYVPGRDRRVRKTAVLSTGAIFRDDRRGLIPLKRRCNAIERARANGSWVGSPWVVEVKDRPAGQRPWHWLVWNPNNWKPGAPHVAGQGNRVGGTLTLRRMRDLFVQMFGIDESTRQGGFKSRADAGDRRVLRQLEERESQRAAAGKARQAAEEEERRAEAEQATTGSRRVVRGFPRRGQVRSGTLFTIKAARVATEVVENGVLEQMTAVPNGANLLCVFRRAEAGLDVRVVCARTTNHGLLPLICGNIGRQWRRSLGQGEAVVFDHSGVTTQPWEVVRTVAGLAT